MKGLIYSEPADLLETGERSKGNEPGINTPIQTMRGAYYAHHTTTCPLPLPDFHNFLRHCKVTREQTRTAMFLST